MSDYPSMSHVQHITFEGNDCVVMSPEEYGAALADLEAKDYELSALRAELTEARRQLAAQPAVPDDVARDAARYRFLRDKAWGKDGALALLPANEMDEAVDAARAALKEQEPND